MTLQGPYAVSGTYSSRYRPQRLRPTQGCRNKGGWASPGGDRINQSEKGVSVVTEDDRESIRADVGPDRGIHAM